jgi:hypothetical protein
MKKDSHHSDAARKQMSQTRQQHPKLGPMTDEELALFRADPEREKSLRIRDYVVCRECGARVAHLDAHLRQHRMTTKQYRGKWPGAPLSSAKVRKQGRTAMRAKRRAHPKKFKTQRRAYYNRNRERLLDQRRAKEKQISRQDYLNLVRRASRPGVLSFPARIPRQKGRKKITAENKRYFKAGEMVERALTGGQELIEARKSAASVMGVSYASVVRYHKQFRRHLARDGNATVISITG